jgi:hypothetical protein
LYPWLVAAPIVGLTVDLVAHVLACGLMRGRRPGTCLLVGFVLGLTATVVLSLGVLAGLNRDGGDSAALLLFNAAIFLALAYGYFHFVNLNVSSIRLGILRDLLGAEQGRTEEEILRPFDATKLVEGRLARLVQYQAIVEREGRYFSRPSVLLFIARGIALLKRVVLGRHARVG